MVDLYTLSVIIFFAILGILIYRDRKRIDFKYILIMRRIPNTKNSSFNKLGDIITSEVISMDF